MIDISVVIPAYNCEDCIARALDSVLRQTRTAREIIVVDDGSTDRTAEIIKGYGTDVCYHYQENLGSSAARNHGVSLAESTWIAFLDADDEWLPDKLERQSDYHLRHPLLYWSFANFYIHHWEHNTRDVAHPAEQTSLLLEEMTYFSDYLEIYPLRIHMQTSTVLIHKRLFAEIGLFRIDQRWVHDYDLFFRIAYRYPQVGYLAEPLGIYYAARPNSLTFQNRGHVQERIDFLDIQLALSEDCGRNHEFKDCARYILDHWIRSMIITKQYAGVRELLKRHGRLLPRKVFWEFYARAWLPPISDILVTLYFKMKRWLKSHSDKEDKS